MGSDLASNRPPGIRGDRRTIRCRATRTRSAVYQLPLAEEPSQPRAVPEVVDLYLLHQNAFWFCRLRWIVVALLLIGRMRGWAGVSARSTSTCEFSAAWPLCAAVRSRC